MISLALPSFSSLYLYARCPNSHRVVVAGGAGGKGTWGKPGQEQDEEGNAMDAHDPNYDSDSLVGAPVFCLAWINEWLPVKNDRF